MQNDNALFYACSLIELIGRQQKQKRSAVVNLLGQETVNRIYRYADVFHCELIEKVADDFITERGIPEGDFNNVADCRYAVPDFWAIGAVYERLIEDVSEKTHRSVIELLFDVYGSWIDEAISNYNTDFFYQSRQYIAACYFEGEILD